MDEATADLALALQVEDLDRLLKTTSTDQAKAPGPDSRVALITYRDEVLSKLHTLRDMRMSRSIAQAVRNDARAVFEARSQENQAVRDRRTAEGIDTIEHVQNGVRPRRFSLARPREIIDLTDDVGDENMRRLATVNNGAPGFIDFTPRPRLTLGQQLRRKRSKEGYTFRSAESDESIIGVKKICASCSEPVPYFTAVYAPCGHDYCKDCVMQLFNLAIRDESIFPPRCCKQSIPLASADVFFTPGFVKEFEEKSIEYTTPNRTYCAWPTCSVFIPPNRINNDVGVCPSCGFWTCTMCKTQSHAGHDCPQDAALNSLVQIARQAGWQRCYNCRRFVELARGCNHITCLCRTEFCYACARPWKTCQCDVWDEANLLDRANQIADRRPAPQVPRPRAEILQEIRNGLEEDEDCNHNEWGRQGHDGTCEFCENWFRHFIYLCRECGIYACAFCRHHRA